MEKGKLRKEDDLSLSYEISAVNPDRTAAYDQRAASAIAKAAAINRVSEQSGVLAKGESHIVAGNTMTAASLLI